ncbi:MAG: hypothetical protein J0M12_08845 [Deltaproteobacteria bacterium]|nr:hypothetical protein [Deltaproteobacteria bacterium]
MNDDHYILLTRISEQPLANKACAALENAGIPVMLEHVEVKSGATRASSYRLFVPSQFTQSAQRVVNFSSSTQIEQFLNN